jgi:uncharacterized protein
MADALLLVFPYMQPSMFNLRVPLEARDEIFLMNTLTDAQLVVSSDVADLLDRAASDLFVGWTPSPEEREALDVFAENGFLVESREADRQALERYMTSVKNDTSELNITLLTTLQCNFACDYCFQGDHGDYNTHADKMSTATAERVADWFERELDRVRPEKFVLTFFGGEPLLNLPAMYLLAERARRAADARGVTLFTNIITNGLLLTPAVVDRMLPFGLNGVKITLDGDKGTHDRMRPLRGGQGTFDRIIANIRAVAGRCRIAIGGNFDLSSAASFPALLDFLKAQDFGDKLVKVNFKPIVRSEPVSGKGIIPLTPVGANGAKETLKGTCMTSVGSGAGAACDSGHTMEEQMTLLRQETQRHGFPTNSGVPMGMCHVHKTHAHTIGPDGSLYACPGFTGQAALSTGHIDDRRDSWRESALEKFERLHPWKECGDCAYIPTCAGGCVAASQSQLGDMNMPTCHKPSFESALISLAHTAASAAN